MAGRRTNLTLLVLTAVAFVSGALAYSAGTAWGRPVTVLHGVVGVGVVLVAPWKGLIVGHGMRRRGARAWASVVLALCTIASVVTGVLHTTGAAVHLGPVTAMQVHVGAALLALPLVIWHVAARPARLRRADLGRRELLRVGGLAGAALVAYVPTTLLGSDRRFTGSRQRGTDRPSAMPVTQWLDDDVPVVDTRAWRLRVGDRSLTYAELIARDDRVRALLDCTGGWYASQHWAGVWLEELLPAGGRSVVVRSLTGYSRRFPRSDAGRLLLATRVAGRPLSAGHGHPARLVAPGRRGFWWVKWLDSVDVDERPWWWQPPFPLT